MAWIDSLFKRMLELEASDLHMTSGRKPMLRVHGDMVVIEECPEIAADQMTQILMEIAPEAAQQQWADCNDADFAYAIPGLARFRSNYFQDSRGPGAVFRVIPEEILTMEQLNLPQSVKDFCYLSKGLVVVTGPTGSGKSTTLAAMVDHMNKNRSDHILTIEDPIEFVHQDHKCLVNQREVGKHTASFKRALKAALREDPDIILVGEMRDLETIEIAIETAETGHLVFGTLHTTTAASTIDRIIDQFPADRQSQIRTMLSGSLKGVVAQTLCKKNPKGRIAALEIMVVNNAISSLIREGKTHQIKSSMQMGGKLGMKLLTDSLVELVKTKVVEPAEAYIKAVDKDAFIAGLAAVGIQFDSSCLGTGPEVQEPYGTSPAAVPAASAPAPAPGTPSLAPPQSLSMAGEAPSAPLPTVQPEAPQAPAAPEAGGGSPSGDPFEAYKQQRHQ
ncbi:MAG: twitching motility protein PilT [Planctomycetota bacterium]|jgi:twitching motility protein PilT